MSDNASKGFFGEPAKRRIGVLIEGHFDETEFKKFNAFFPKHGYQVVYITQLWGNRSLYDPRPSSRYPPTSEYRHPGERYQYQAYPG